METKQGSLWTKDFTLLWITNFLMAIGFYFLLPTLPFYAIDIFGAKESQVGYIVGVYTLSALAIRPLAGYSLDYLGRKKVYLFALGIFALLVFTYPLASSLITLLLIRFLHGLSWGVTTTGGGTIVADLIPAQRRGEGVGYYGLTMTIAMALGPALGLWIMGDHQFDRLFLLSGLLMASAFIMANLISYPKVESVKKPLSWNSFFENSVFPISIVILFTTFVYGGVVSFIVVYSKQMGFENGGLFFLIYAVAMSLIRPLSGKLVDRRGPNLVVITGFVFLVSGFISLAASSGLILFTVAATTLGIGNGMIWPTLQTMIINMVAPDRRGVANSTYMSALDLGIGSGSIILGVLADFTTIGTMYFISGLFVILPFIYFVLYVAKDYQKKMSLKASQKVN